MASRGTKISEATVKEELSGTDKFPISDGSGEAKAVTADTIKDYCGGGSGKVNDVLVDGTSVLDSAGNAKVDLTGKVDKVSGKGLSTNDYSNTEKAQVAANKTAIATETSRATGVEGSLANLTTTNKSTLVGAINEVKSSTTDLELETGRLQDILGLYTDRASLILDTTKSTKGKAIVPVASGSIYGKIADYENAYVSEEFTLTRGDLLLIKPGKTANDLFTVAQVVSNSDGTKSYTKVMQLNATAELPTDGYARFLVMPSDMTVVITFFPAETAFSSEIRVMRCGSFASICTQVGNIYAELVSNYCRKDGLYPNLTAGMALGLVGSEDTVTSKKVLGYQFSDDDKLSPYSGAVPSFSIKGRSIAWRQIVDNNGADAGTDGPAIGGTYYIGSSVYKDKPYLMRAQTADGVWEWRVVFVGTETTFAAAAEEAFGYAQKVVADGDEMGSKCVDLVLAFGVTECLAWGTDSETNLKKVAQLWGFATWADFAGGMAQDGVTQINTQWEYLTTYRAEGELISTKIPAVIRSYKYDTESGEEVLVAEREVPEAVLQAFPDGILRQAGSVCDEINETECVKRVYAISIYDNIQGYTNNTLVIKLPVTGKARTVPCVFSANNKGRNTYVNSSGISVYIEGLTYSSYSEAKEAYNGSFLTFQLATPVTTSLSTPLSLAVLDSTTLLTFAPTDTQEPYAPAQLDMTIDRDYAAIVKQLAINAGIWN